VQDGVYDAFSKRLAETTGTMKIAGQPGWIGEYDKVKECYSSVTC
jgi:hypothetical protein